MPEPTTREGILPRIALTVRGVLSTLLAPALHLWPWLLANLVFFCYLSSPQGLAVATEMAGADWVSGPALQALGVSFACTLAACLLTSLVVTSAARPTPPVTMQSGEPGSDHQPPALLPGALASGRTRAGVHILWGFALAATAPVAFLLAAIPSSGTGWVIVVLLVPSVLAFAVLGRSWSNGEAWTTRIKSLHGRRAVLVALVLLFAIAPLLLGANALTTSPLSAGALGSVFVAMLGLLALASLVGVCFVTIPYCLPAKPYVGIAIVGTVVLANVLTQPLVDSANPLLVEKLLGDSSVSRFGQDIDCASRYRGTRRSVVNRAEAVRDIAARENRVPSLFFVSAEGGGIRAAYWTALGLWSMDQSNAHFQERLASLSGVSGGSLGIATWLAAVDATDEAPRQRELIEKFLGTDFLSPAIGGLLFLDAPRLLFGSLWPSPRRDDVFEAALVQRWQDVVRELRVEGADFFLRPIGTPCFMKGKNPPLVYFNATDAVTGNYISAGPWAEARLQGGRKRISSSAGLIQVERERAAGAWRPETVIEAVVTSASFPFLGASASMGVEVESLAMALGNRSMPSAASAPESGTDAAKQLKGVARLGVFVDGGYFDNSGLTRSREALAALDLRELPPVAMQPNEKTRRSKSTDDVAAFVVHLRNDPASACFPPGDWRPHTSWRLQRLLAAAPDYEPTCRFELEDLEEMLQPSWLGWIVTPVRTVWALRDGHVQQELSHMRDLALTRTIPGAFVEYSLAEQLTASLCSARPEPIDRENCRRVARGLKPVREGRASSDAEFTTGRAVAAPESSPAPCRDVPLDPPLALGWTLNSRDKHWMGCLSNVGALYVRGRLDSIENSIRQVQALDRKAEENESLAAQRAGKQPLAVPAAASSSPAGPS